MILTALPLAGVTAFAQDEQEYTSGDFKYVLLEDGTAEITAYTGKADKLEIPSSLDEHKVTSLGLLSLWNGAFESVTIPDSITKIGASVFQNCAKLTTVTIPASVASIDSTSFEGCEALTEIKVDEGNKNYTSQDGVLFTADKAELVQYPIGNARTSYEIPSGVAKIGDWAFCASILANVTIPESVKTIGEGTFQDCCNLNEIVIPNGVESIGNSAFFNSGLTSVQLSESVTSIGNATFGGCRYLKEITAAENSKSFSSQDGVLFSKDKTVLVCYPFGCRETEYAIPNGVESIGDWAFYCCYYLTSITIPDGVKFIGESAFCNCNELVSVTVPGSVDTIGEGAFQNCSSLSSVAIKNGVKHIDSWAFAWCDGLTFIVIPRTVENIEESAFENCNSLDSIFILNKNCVLNNVSLLAETEIYCYEGSTAESYAKAYGNVFNVSGYTVSDATAILRHIANIELIDESIEAIADVNADGKITLTDAKWVLQVVAGLRNESTMEPIK